MFTLKSLLFKKRLIRISAILLCCFDRGRSVDDLVPVGRLYGDVRGRAAVQK